MNAPTATTPYPTVTSYADKSTLDEVMAIVKGSSNKRTVTSITAANTVEFGIQVDL